MKSKKNPVHIIFVIAHSTLAIVTLLPAGFVSKASYLGYKSLCSFSITSKYYKIICIPIVPQIESVVQFLHYPTVKLVQVEVG